MTGMRTIKGGYQVDGHWLEAVKLKGRNSQLASCFMKD